MSGIKGLKDRQWPIELGSAGKRDVRAQFAALPWRMRGGEVEVLLITSRKRKRWILPKGWPVHGHTPAQAAQREAFEEAGVEGRISGVCLGLYSHVKELEEERLRCVVAIFPLQVERERETWPERHQRKRRWVGLKQAAALIDHAEVKPILRSFRPDAGGS